MCGGGGGAGKSVLFFVPYAFCSARLFVTHAAGRAKKNTPGAFFVRHAAGRGWPSKKKNSGAARARFLLLGTRLAQQKNKHSGAAGARFFLFGTRLAQQKEKPSGAAGARFFLFGTRLAQPKKTRGGRGAFIFCSGRGWSSKKNTPGGFFLLGTRPVTHSLAGRGSCGPFFRGALFFVFRTRLDEQKKTLRARLFLLGTRPVTHSLAGRGSCGPSFTGALFLFGTRLAEQKALRALLFFARDAPGHSLTCGPGVVRAFLEGRVFFCVWDAAGRAKKKHSGRVFSLLGTRPVTHSLASRGVVWAFLQGCVFFCSGRGWPSKTKEKEKSWPRACLFFLLGTRLAEQKEGKGKSWPSKKTKHRFRGGGGRGCRAELGWAGAVRPEGCWMQVAFS